MRRRTYIMTIVDADNHVRLQLETANTRVANDFLASTTVAKELSKLIDAMDEAQNG